MLLFLCYPKCSTCKKAQAFLDEKGLRYDVRDIKLNNPDIDELRLWWERSGLPLKRFFNTSGLQYKALGLKEKLPEMSDEELLLQYKTSQIFNKLLRGSRLAALVGISCLKYAFFHNLLLQLLQINIIRQSPAASFKYILHPKQ